VQEAAFTFHLFFACQMKVVGHLASTEMTIKAKRFLLVTLAACVAIDLVVLWMLW
jgi:hypothetical protein